MTVADKVVLITGAARGIGLGIAQVLVRAGAKVVLADRLDEVAETAAAIGPRAHAIRCDVSTPQANQAMVAEAVRVFGRLDGLSLPPPPAAAGPSLK